MSEETLRRMSNQHNRQCTCDDELDVISSSVLSGGASIHTKKYGARVMCGSDSTLRHAQEIRHRNNCSYQSVEISTWQLITAHLLEVRTLSVPVMDMTRLLIEERHESGQLGSTDLVLGHEANGRANWDFSGLSLLMEYIRSDSSL